MSEQPSSKELLRQARDWMLECIGPANDYEERRRIVSQIDCALTASEPPSLLARCEEWIRAHPHGDNCFLTAEYPGNTCVRGKDSLLDAFDASPASPPVASLIETLRRIADPDFRYSSDDDEDTQLSLRMADALAALNQMQAPVAAPKCEHCKDTGIIAGGNGYIDEPCNECDAHRNELARLTSTKVPGQS